MSSEASSSGNNSRESVVEDWGRQKGSCCYCKSGDRTSICHGLWAHSITVDDYQDLLDQGWSRSGCFLYKPEMERTCCPSYTIRLKASAFVPSKEQLQVNRRMQRFLDGKLDVRKPVQSKEDPSTSNATGSCVNQVSNSVADKSLSHNNKEENKTEDFMHYLSNQIDNAVHVCIEGGEFPSGIQLPKALVKKVSHAKKKLLAEGSEDLVYTSNIAYQIAATLKRSQSAAMDVYQSKIIAEKLVNSLNHSASISALSIRACNAHVNFYSPVKYGSLDGNAQIVTLPEESAKRNGSKSSASKNVYPHKKKRKFEIRLKRSSFDPEEYALYKRYQIKVHNDTPDHVTENSYRTFLVDSPLLFVQPSITGLVPPSGFGSFHQQYIIDGQLVAVGVIDILPKCFSSKYFFWDPDFAFLSLGKYSALQEIAWIKENEVSCPSLQYYYLGYYVHSCSKMRYKAAYWPSELLCPFQYQWVPFDVARPLLDKKKYVVLSSLQDGESSQSGILENIMELQQDEIDQEDRNDVCMDNDEEMLEPKSEGSDDESEPETSNLMSVGIKDGNLTNILIGLRGSRMRYKDIQQASDPSDMDNLEAQLQRYQRVVGVELSERMICSLD
ncbi:hypothetical protein SLA2020_061930 [Shorea laevis]